MNRSSTSSCTRIGSAPGRSILLITTMGVRPSSSAFQQHEPRLRHRAVERVDDEQHAVHHAQDALDLAAEVGVAEGVDDVDLVSFHRTEVFFARMVIPRALQRVGIHHARRRPGCPGRRRPAEQLVDERGLAMIDVRDDGDIANLHSLEV